MEVVNRILFFFKKKKELWETTVLSVFFHTKQIVRCYDEKKTRQMGWIDTGGIHRIAGLLESFRRADTSVDEDDPLDTVYLASPKADDRSHQTICLVFRKASRCVSVPVVWTTCAKVCSHPHV